ncbi:DUF1353 domain-containing protein [Dyadobacter sp. 676]|uniref:DUF1353 domain-containing protein n=1 Tax=Dyadobacter sp. 676 TaxID=3088362 RepID=A0AAU8FPY1_9BACT
MTQYPDIHLRKSPDRFNWWEVVEDCTVESKLPGMVIPAGYRTDFATIPRLLWPLMPPHGRMANAAIAHDYAYDNRLGEAEFGETQARLRACVEFALRASKTAWPDWQMSIAYIFIRLFGRKWWRN